MRQRLKRICFYAPVPRRLFRQWDWYQSDLEVLKELAESVDVCFSFPEYLRKFWKASIVYGAWWHLCLPAIGMARLAGIPFVVTGAMHVFDPSGQRHFFKAGFFYRKAHSLAFQLADANLFISKDQFNSITNNFQVRNPFLVYSSLRKSQQQQKKINRKPKSRKYIKTEQYLGTTFLTICWLTQDQCARKGVWPSFDAMRMLRNRTKEPFRWILAGRAGNAVSSLEKEIESFNLKDVVILKTNISVQEKKHLFQKSDLYVQPSWCEGLGYAVIEAVSHGCPALVSRYSAQPEVIHSQGLMVREITPEEICEKLHSFLFLKKPVRQKLVEANMNHVFKTFSFKKHVKTLGTIINTLKIKH